MKRRVALVFLPVAILLSGALLIRLYYPAIRDRLSVFEDPDRKVSYTCMAREKAFYLYRNGRWEMIFIRGVNIGAARPGSFPGELAITKEEYLRWFRYIRDMHADAIRVYTLQSPAFYQALWEFNRNSLRPLYLFHGVWIDENAISETMNAFSPAVTQDFRQNIREVVDAIHGNARIPRRKGKGWGACKDSEGCMSPFLWRRKARGQMLLLAISCLAGKSGRCQVITSA